MDKKSLNAFKTLLLAKREELEKAYRPDAARIHAALVDLLEY